LAENGPKVDMPTFEQTFLRMPCVRMEDRTGIAARAIAFARGIGFDQRACWEIGIVVQELAANIVRYAGGGHVELHAGPGLVEVISIDAGPGIPTQVMATQEFWSRGLGAVRRLMHELVIDTRYESGDCQMGDVKDPKIRAIRGTRVYTRRYVGRKI
jgi:anti-sigma regulatory factor (Ser/Thr protein kinase)